MRKPKCTNKKGLSLYRDEMISWLEVNLTKEQLAKGSAELWLYHMWNPSGMVFEFIRERDVWDKLSQGGFTCREFKQYNARRRVTRPNALANIYTKSKATYEFDDATGSIETSFPNASADIKLESAVKLAEKEVDKNLKVLSIGGTVIIVIVMFFADRLGTFGKNFARWIERV